MSGGRFDYWSLDEEIPGSFDDKEMEELLNDLFVNGRFAVRSYGGLLQTLDFYLCSDIDEKVYRKKVAAFKEKWFRRTPRNRITFYQDELQKACDRFKMELGLAEWKDED